MTGEKPENATILLQENRRRMLMAKRKRSGAKRSGMWGIRVNRQYKDTVFRMLFTDKRNLLSLYNAIGGTSYTDPEQLQIVTLEHAVYMGMKNDLAFIIDTNLFLYEHQSTYNPNMPMRDLFYIASEYQKMVDNKLLYTTVLQKVPAPKFLVFYNGSRKMEDSHTEYLSSAFENLAGEADLELKVTILNINAGHNQKLMEQCRTLKEYAQYVDRVRGYVPEMGLNAAVSRAVSECIHEGILTEFLRQNRAEVEKVSIFEYDKEVEERKLRKAEFRGGLQKGAEALIRIGKTIDLSDEVIRRVLREELGLDEEDSRETLRSYLRQNHDRIEKVNLIEDES